MEVLTRTFEEELREKMIQAKKVNITLHGSTRC